MPCGTTGGEHAGFLTRRIRLPVITGLLDLTQKNFRWESVENGSAVQVLLHVVQNDAVVSRKATSVVLVVNCRNSPSVTGTQQRRSDEIEGELLHDDSLRKEYGEVCVGDEEGGDSGSSPSNAADDL